MEEQNKIIFDTIDGEQIELYVEEKTTLNGNNYILVTDSMDEEANAMILKEVSVDDETFVYEEVENELELEAVADVFAELLEDVDIDY